jgi:hypothetical protein
LVQLNPILLKNIFLKMTPTPCRNGRSYFRKLRYWSAFAVSLTKTDPTKPWAQTVHICMLFGGVMVFPLLHMDCLWPIYSYSAC